MKTSIVAALLAVWLLAGCAGGGTVAGSVPVAEDDPGESYVIGAGDGLQVFVWGHDELTTVVQVRPDGHISTPLVEDLQAAGKTPTELARSVEEVLAEYVRSPTVTIIVQRFVGSYDQQIRVVGEATEPQSLSFRDGMTVLDVMIEVGGLSEFASGNRAKIVRRRGGHEEIINVKIRDLLNKGDMSQNVRMVPGDVLMIPQSIF